MTVTAESYHAGDAPAADAAARARGFADLQTYVALGLASGRSLTALGSAIGLDRGWLSRHADAVLGDSAWPLGVQPDRPRHLRLVPAP